MGEGGKTTWELKQTPQQHSVTFGYSFCLLVSPGSGGLLIWGPYRAPGASEKDLLHIYQIHTEVGKGNNCVRYIFSRFFLVKTQKLSYLDNLGPHSIARCLCRTELFETVNAEQSFLTTSPKIILLDYVRNATGAALETYKSKILLSLFPQVHLCTRCTTTHWQLGLSRPLNNHQTLPRAAKRGKPHTNPLKHLPQMDSLPASLKVQGFWSLPGHKTPLHRATAANPSLQMAYLKACCESLQETNPENFTQTLSLH